MEYQLIKDDDGNISTLKLTTEDEAVMFIPMDEANTDYQKYIEWTKASPKNVAVEAD